MAIKWNKCDLTMAYQLSGITAIPGRVYPYPNDALPESIQTSMPGLKETYVSGYLNPKATNFSSISGFGEMAIVREGENVIKSYNYIFALDGDENFYFAGPYKDFPEHHTPITGSLPLEKLFGNTPTS